MRVRAPLRLPQQLKQMKVIFMDHDGVICLESEWGSRFDKKRNMIHAPPSKKSQSWIGLITSIVVVLNV